MGEWINRGIDWLLNMTQLHGFSILLLTIPLAIIQGFFGFFPFSTLILLQISVLGLINGLFTSWLIGIVASIVVYYCCKFLFADWFNRKMQRNVKRFEKWQKYFVSYGVWFIILLRTLPIMPNNVISFMASISSIRSSSYIISSLVGNLSHIWLFGIISSSILMPNTDIRLLIGSYIAFCLLILGLFGVQQQLKRKKQPLA